MGVRMSKSFELKTSRSYDKPIIAATVSALAVDFCLYLIGFIVNVNVPILIGTVVYCCFLVYSQPRFVLRYFWILTAIASNIVGTYACDTGLYLEELGITSYYANTLAPLAGFWILFLGLLAISFDGAEQKKDCYADLDLKWLSSFMILGLILALFVFSQVWSRPYFLTGYDRFGYSKNVFTGLPLSIKGHLIVFVPLAALCFRTKGRVLGALFLLTYVVDCIWVGDKFGAFFLIAYVLCLSFEDSVSDSSIKKAVASMLAAVLLMLVVVFVQNSILRGYSFEDNVQYLFNRTAQDGQVWWSVCSQVNELAINASPFTEEIMACFSADVPAGSYGQWKMMAIAAHDSSFVKARIASLVPYSDTTEASIYYYFSLPGLLIFACISACLYSSFIAACKRAFTSDGMVRSMVMAEFITVVHNFLFASNIADVISVKTLVLVMTLFFSHALARKTQNASQKARCINEV